MTAPQRVASQEQRSSNSRAARIVPDFQASESLREAQAVPLLVKRDTKTLQSAGNASRPKRMAFREAVPMPWTTAACYR